VSETSFASLGLSAPLLTAVEELGFKTLTPIQEQSLPHLLAGRDVVGQSRTGSGKTAAFGLALLEKIDLTHHFPQALILCPTRELATQVGRDVRDLGRRMPGLQVAILAGGQPAREQARTLEGGTHIAVGTPGRVRDLFERGSLELTDVKALVLDEADKMLELGFEEEVRAVLEAVPVPRQTIFFSATFPDEIQKWSRTFQNKPVSIKVDEPAEENTIEQIAYEVDGERWATLLRVLQQHPAAATIVFANQKVTVIELEERLRDLGASVGALHGDLEQRERDRAMAMFRNGSHRVLIATDVAARGLDIDNLDVVVNYELPHHVETYVHRVGRTGRAGRAGLAVSLFDDHDDERLSEITQQTGNSFERPKLGFKNQFGMMPENKYSPWVTLSISGGRKDKLRPGDILGALTGDAGLAGSDVGKIEILDKLSYVAVNTAQAEKALARLRQGKIKGQKFRVQREE